MPITTCWIVHMWECYGRLHTLKPHSNHEHGLEKVFYLGFLITETNEDYYVLIVVRVVLSSKGGPLCEVVSVAVY